MHHCSYATMYPYTGTPTLLALRHEDGYAPSFMVFGGGVSCRHRATMYERTSSTAAAHTMCEALDFQHVRRHLRTKIRARSSVRSGGAHLLLLLLKRRPASSYPPIALSILCHPRPPLNLPPAMRTTIR